MSEAVFEDTPLADYLSDVGIEDWGIDESPAATLVQDGTELRQLKLSESSTYTSEARFRSLLRSALKSELPSREVAEFLDQFRYQIVTSNLLEERPIYATWSRSTAERRMDLLFSTKGPWDMLKIPEKYWVGGGGCVVLIVSLFSLKLQRPEGKFERISLIGTLLVVLYLFSHSRRRMLRLLHRKALGHVCLFAHQQKILDGDCIRALQSIQQTDSMVSSGARKLRSVLWSCLHLLSEQYIDAIKDTLCMSSELELQRYWEIYDLTSTQQKLKFIMNDDFIGFEHDDPILGAASCHVPLGDLKLKFQKVHFLRRAFLCCLLTANSTGKCTAEELEGWTVISDHLVQIKELSTQVCNLLSKERVDPKFQEPPCPAGDKSVISLNLISQHIATRMDILTNCSLTSEDYDQHVQQLHADITNLNNMWRAKYSKTTHSHQESIPSTPDTLVTEANSVFSDFSFPEDKQNVHVHSNSQSQLQHALPKEPRVDLTVRDPFERDVFMNELTKALRQRSAR